MKIFIYYIKILIPIFFIFFFLNYNAYLLIAALLIYVFLYRNFIDSQRLKDLGLIDRMTISPVKLFKYRIKYFHDLYFRV